MERNFFLGRYLIWVTLLLGQLHGYKSCVEEERNALLEVKKYIISITREEVSDYINVLPTWTYDTKSDCCRWEGVKCNRTSRRVTGIAFGTLYLKENSLLNLSLLHPFQDVRSLNLSKNEDNYFNGLFDDVEGYKSLGRLRSLEILDLSLNAFNNSIFPFLNAATSLTTLSLRRNFMDGPFPAKQLKDLTNLELLDLGENKFNGSIPIRVLPGMRKLKALDLSWICQMTNIQELDLSRNKLVGPFPSCLFGLTRIQVLDLSSNQLTGKVPPALGSLGYLKYLSLLDNNFEGVFSLGSLANLSELRFFQLSSKSKSLQVESEGSWKAKFQLRVFELPSCNLVRVPNFLLYQKDLIRINLSNNTIFGNNSLTSFQLPESAHNLAFLDVSANDFNHVLPENIGWVLPHLQYMKLGDNSFQGCLPSSLGNMKEILYLDLSHNNNKLSGEVFLESVNFTGIWELYMDNNLFTGNIGQGLRSLRSLTLFDISNNNLTGVIPSWIGEFTVLSVLLLSNNSLEGEIPISLFNTSDLQILDLSANNLSGDIPPQVSWGSPSPVALFLQDNNLSGVIPDTLLGNVSVLDLRNNKLSGNIPEPTGSRSAHGLLLRGNNLTGSIPRQLCGLINLKLLDLANNRLSGSIPSCFSDTSFSSGGKKGSIYFKYLVELDPLNMGYMSNTLIKAEFATKHRYDTYLGENLELLFGMDLSGNELSGNIPADFGSLLKLQALNLSHNKLSGLIPESFSGLKNVESLDLSFNMLQGRIPSQITEQTSLAVFNVSYNNLSGVIPQGKQFNTFSTQSYFDNPLLCGQPTNISCDNSNFQEPDNGVEADNHNQKMEGKFFLGQSVIWAILLLGQLHGYKSCVEKERNALLELKKYLISITEEKDSDSVFPTWPSDTNSDCCRWEGVKCNRTSRRVIEIAFGELYLKELSPLNLSLLHPYEDVRCLNLSNYHGQFNGMFDDGYKSLSRLINLEFIDLSWNIFNNSIFPFLNAATSLKTLFLRSNNMDGPFPAEELKDLTNLELLDLSGNEFNSSTPIRAELPILRKLKALNLSGNEFSASMELQGKSWICEMKNIEELDLSHNKLVGQFPLCLIGMTRLRAIDLTSNQLTGKVPSALGNLGSLKYLSLLDNNFEGFFSLGSLANLSELRVLKLGSKSKSFQVEYEGSWKPKFKLSVIELSSCNLVKIPYFLLYQKDLSRIDFSGNKISGDFPNWLLINNTKLKVLFLQNNSLLDLSANTLSGGIPPHVNVNSDSKIPVVLLLHDNKLSGVIPDTLLTNVSVLDLRNNRLSGNIPMFTNLQDTHTLLLRGNNLTGSIPGQVCGLKSIQLLEKGFRVDTELTDFKSPIVLDPFSIIYLPTAEIQIEFVTKHRYDAYVGRNLELLFGMDLSGNELSGDIPADLGRLLELQALNLSHNNLSGLIPENFSGLKSVESLDLSFNRLHGRIPSQLTELNSLSVFSVSFNNLSGVIPQGKQFNTFDAQSYLGNRLLCGQSINTSCNSSYFQEPDNEVEADESAVDMVSFYWSLAAAYVSILLGILSSLSFESPWSRFWFYLVDSFIHKTKNLLW
ncbi:hypothetical protein Bca4012_057826 [Brassica carinata]